MRTDKDYAAAIGQAKENMTDVKERGAAAIGDDVLTFMDEI